VPFGYYQRLSRSQQAVYRRSDEVTQLRLRQPSHLRPAVAVLEVALAAESLAQTQAASERLIRGLTQSLDIPPARVEVLTARPHARWGELHGLYETVRGGRPKITLWMRTAKQRRVVAFRTYLRTLLHEVGHHVDYTLLKLPDSFHTEGFYKRESSLFHQLVPREEDTMPTMEDVAKMPLEDQLRRTLEGGVRSRAVTAEDPGRSPGVLSAAPPLPGGRSIAGRGFRGASPAGEDPT
jgi:hypothetical protein